MASLRFEQPGHYIKAPFPLRPALMSSLGLTGDLHIIACQEHGRSGTSAPTTVTPSLIKTLATSKAWVELVLNGNKSAWWNPKKNKTQWAKPLILVHGVHEMPDMVYQEVIVDGGVTRWYHMKTNRVHTEKPATMTAIAVKYQKQPKPQQIVHQGLRLKKISSGKVFRSLIGYPGPQIDEASIRARQKQFQKSLYYCDPNFLDDEGIRIIIHSGIDQFLGFDIRSDYCRVNILAGMTEVHDNGNMSLSRLLLSMALLERYWNKGLFDMQEGYIHYVCKNRTRPELWCQRVSVNQAKTVHKICRALRWRRRSQLQNIQNMDPTELSTFKRNEMLVKLLFPEDFAGRGELNQDAVSHQPLKFPVARGQANIKHPTHAMPSKLFKRIEQFFLCPDTRGFWTKAKAGQMRDSGDAMDEDMDEDMDDDAGSLEIGEEEDVQAEEDEERFDMPTYDTNGRLDDHSMDLLTQDIKEVELREGLDEDLSHVAGRFQEIVLDLEKGMNERPMD